MEHRKKNDEEWRSIVLEEQIKIGSTVGNVIDVCTYEVLKSRLAVALFGIPELPQSKEDEILSYKHYPNDKQPMLEKLAQCIFNNQSKISRCRIYIGFVFVFGRTLGNEPRNFHVCVFRIPDGNGQFKFIDEVGRLYKDWDHYIMENILPKATICFPKHGFYKGNGEINFAKTPQAHIKNEVLEGTDIACTVLGVASAICMGASLFTPIGAPILLTSLAVSSVTGAYGMGRSIESLVDKGEHHQSLSLLDSEARSAWLGATLPVFGIAASGGCAFLAVASRAGMTITNGAKVAINVANGINCAALGINLGNDIYSVVDNSNSPQHIIQLVGSALLFTNAVISTYQARMILKSRSESNFLSFFSKPEISDSGMGVRIRPTNIIDTEYLRIVLQNGFIKNVSFIFDIPPQLCNKIEEIIFKVLNMYVNTNYRSLSEVKRVLTLFHELWIIIKKMFKENVHGGNDEWEKKRKYIGDIPGSSVFEVLEKLKYLEKVIGEEMIGQEQENYFESTRSKEDFCKNVIKYFEGPKLQEVLGKFKEFSTHNITHFTVHSTKVAEILYFAYPKACDIDYHKLVKTVIDPNSRYTMSENGNNCMVNFIDTDSQYSLALITVQESHRGYILRKYK